MRFPILLGAVAISATLTGCSTSDGGMSRSLESVHQPVIRNANYVFDVDTTSGMLTPSDAQRVSDWLQAMNVRYGDRIAIDESNGAAPRVAIDNIAALLSSRGMLLSDAAPITQGTIAPGNMRIVLSRASARVPGCPDWSDTSTANYNNRSSSNYGCATNANMASMVADANDLIRGNSAGASDPLTASGAIKKFRSSTTSGGGGAASSSGGGQ